MTGTPQVNTPQYPPPPQYGQPYYPLYPPPPVDYGQPPQLYQEIVCKEPPVFKSEVQERDFQINPDRDMPLPLRKCKLCGYKGYGEYFKNHRCVR
jgi:hypothetical protein